MTRREATAVIFDLDDTLSAERDYVASALRTIARRAGERSGVDSRALLSLLESEFDSGRAFDKAEALTGGVMTAAEMLEIYRTAIPDISLRPSTEALLANLRREGYTLGIITDGRTLTQTNKFKALGLDRYIDQTLLSISEAVEADKLSDLPWERMERLTPRCTRRIYCGDNPAKDFVRPNSRGWTTVALRDSGRNIHPQHFESVPLPYRPDIVIDSLDELHAIAADPDLQSIKSQLKNKSHS